MVKNIVIFGAPGSGKGTQSDKMIEKYGLNHISTGDVLRAEIKNGTELGKTAKSYIDQGQLIPDDLMVSILASVYDSFGREHKGVIFDGFPRTIPQAEALKKMLDERGDKVAAMIELDVPEDELMKRLILRGQQSGRADDNEETIKKRLYQWSRRAGSHLRRHLCCHRQDLKDNEFHELNELFEQYLIRNGDMHRVIREIRVIRCRKRYGE